MASRLSDRTGAPGPPPRAPWRRVDHAVGGVEDAHPAALDRAELDPDAGRAAAACRPPRCPATRRRSWMRIGCCELVDLDRVVAAHAGVADVDDREPAVRGGRAGAAGQPEMDLVDEAARRRGAGRRPRSRRRRAGRSGRPRPCRSRRRARRSPRCTGFATRSARLVVATEQLYGWRGMPTTQFSRRWTLIRRKLPAFGGTPWSEAVEDADHRAAVRGGLGQVEAAGLAVGVVAQVDLDRRLLGVDLDRRP